MIENPPGSDERTRQLALAEAYDLESRSWRRAAALSESPEQRTLFVQIAAISSDTARRIRKALGAQTVPPIVTEPTPAATNCPLDGCAGHPLDELRTVADVAFWLVTNPDTCEGWASMSRVDLEMAAMRFLAAREAVRMGRYSA